MILRFKSIAFLLLTSSTKFPFARSFLNTSSLAVFASSFSKSTIANPSPTTSCRSRSSIISTTNHNNCRLTTMCSETNNSNDNDKSSSTSKPSNPLLDDWSTQPFHLPPFHKIQPCHFKEAFEQGMAQHLIDLDEIVNSSEPPTFQNTIEAYDRAGALLDRISQVFSNMCSSLNTEELKLVQTEMVPILSRHSSSVTTYPGLFERISAVYHDSKNSKNDDTLSTTTKTNSNNLTPEQHRLMERFYMDFTRSGAAFSPEEKKEYAEIKAQLASLQTQFSQNVMIDEESFEIVLTLEDMEGCPASLIEAAKQAAKERNKDEKDYVITLSRSLMEPFLTFSPRRDLREKAWREWTRRGELSSERANLPIALQILKLRKRQAEMHGCKTFAEYQCKDMMAKTPENVMTLLENVWERAKISANKERESLEAYCKDIGDTLEDGIQPWDWRYYAEKVRIAKYDFDESVLRPYLSLSKVTDAMMAVSNKLFGLHYIKRDDIQSYHPDVDTYEVRETLEDGTDKLVAIFIHDNFARKYKSSGAWMSEYRGQTKNLKEGENDMLSIPIISNNNNFAKSSGPTLLSMDDSVTLFHEAGHGHHGMLSDVTYSRLAGTSVLTDFVELPSQLMEHWLEQPEVLKEYALHYETNEPIPDELLNKLKAAKSFNQGFETIEYTSCALLDMALHQLEDYDDLDISEFEKKELDRLGMPQGIIMRHRPAHFLHLFASSHYASGYYVYLWAEVLDADAFAAFKETGDIFDPETAKRVKKYIYSSGNTVAPDELFRSFRGRDPDIQFMLEKKGLA